MFRCCCKKKEVQLLTISEDGYEKYCKELLLNIILSMKKYMSEIEL
jgi:hypothetical protein